MKILPRTKFGNPILRQRARRISPRKVSNQLLKTMFYTMRQVSGVGLAAPQVNKSWQLAVIEIKKSKIRPEIIPLKKTVVINPEITRRSKKLLKDWEGCLSLPKIRGLVPRHKDVTVRFLDSFGKKQVVRLSGFQARVFQHEIDHLKGILYIDRMDDMKTLITEDEFRKRVIKKSGLKSK